MKSIFAPHLGRNVKFGRRRSPVKHPHLRLGNYLRANLPTPPESGDYSAAALPVLRDIFGNDQLGDCVIAGANHILGVETGNAGNLFHTTESDIIAQYSAIGGYVPGNPATDNGCELSVALAYYAQRGFSNGTKLLGYLSVDAANKQEVMAACYLFENLYHAFELPDAWINPFPSSDGFVWDAATPDPNNGHCVMSCGYDATGVKIGTWGLLGTVTWNGLAKLGVDASGGELWVMLTPDQLAKGANKAPNGVDWVSLIADWDAMGGNVPAPVPPAPPSPNPPSSPPTLAQAQAAVVAALQAQHPLLTRLQAEQAASQALAGLWP